MRKWKNFLSLNRRFKHLLVESYFYLAWARILKIVTFAKVAPSLGIEMEETSYRDDSMNKSLLIDISQAVHIMSRYTFWESECLVKAIAAMRMLERRRIESTLYLGTGRDGNGKLAAHAWLRCGPYYISGSEKMGKFTVVATFAKKIKS